MLIITSILLLVDFILFFIALIVFRDINKCKKEIRKDLKNINKIIKPKKFNDGGTKMQGLEMLINDLDNIKRNADITELVVKPKVVPGKGGTLEIKLVYKVISNFGGDY